MVNVTLCENATLAFLFMSLEIFPFYIETETFRLYLRCSDVICKRVWEDCELWSCKLEL